MRYINPILSLVALLALALLALPGKALAAEDIDVKVVAECGVAPV